MTAAGLLAACKKEEPPPVYQAIPVDRRDIVVSALASGTVQPDTVVEVKSKASGEILDIKVETGTGGEARRPAGAGGPAHAAQRRSPRPRPISTWREARLANADVAEAARPTSCSSPSRSPSRSTRPPLLDYANAQGRSGARPGGGGRTRRIQMDDTDVRAPDQRHHHREDGRARPGDLVAHQRRRRRHRAAQDGRPRPGAGPHPGGRDRHRQDPGRASARR